jgi:hypothetical protein
MAYGRVGQAGFLVFTATVEFGTGIKNTGQQRSSRPMAIKKNSRLMNCYLSV